MLKPPGDHLNQRAGEIGPKEIQRDFRLHAGTVLEPFDRFLTDQRPHLLRGLTAALPAQHHLVEIGVFPGVLKDMVQNPLFEVQAQFFQGCFWGYFAFHIRTMFGNKVLDNRFDGLQQ